MLRLRNHDDNDDSPGHEGREVKDGGADGGDLCVGKQRSDLRTHNISLDLAERPDHLAAL